MHAPGLTWADVRHGVLLVVVWVWGLALPVYVVAEVVGHLSVIWLR